MSWSKKLIHRKTLRKAEALVVAATLTITSVPPMNVLASESFKPDLTDALQNVLDAMSVKEDYDTAAENLSQSIESLEGAETVTGLVITDIGEDHVTLEWDAFEADNLKGYNVYWADKDTDTEVFLKLTKDGKKTEDNSVITVDADTTSFTYHKSTHKNYYFKVAPVFETGEASKTEAVESPTANEFLAYLENLDRGIVKIATSEGVFLSWRLLGTEVTGYGESGLVGTDFNVYQDGNLVATVTDSTNYVVAGGSIDSDYVVVPVSDGVELTEEKSESAIMMDTTDGAGYLDIPLQVPHATTIEEVYGVDTSDITLLKNDRTDTYTTTAITYSANDVSVGDVDGDGEYEFFVKWDPSLAKDVSQQGFTGKQYIDCYKLDGTLLYRIDLGTNIRAGAHYSQFIVYDLNEDGKAEISMKTAPGTKVITFNNNNQDDIASETYITTPDGTSNDADFVFTAEEYREYLIGVFMDWGVWANDSEDMIEAKQYWDKNIINLFAPEDGTVTVVTESDGKYTSSTVSREEAGFTEDDVLVNVPVRDAAGNVVYKSSGVANAYMHTVRFDDPETGLSASMYHEGGYTREEAEALVDYFLNGYQYRMKKHNLNNYEGYIITGPEYLSVFDGETGVEMDTIMYEFEREDDGMLWGDYAMNYMEPGNRCDRFLSTVAYLDGENPYMIVARGYYTRATIATYTLNAEGKLQLHWTIDSGWTVMTNPFNDGPHGMNGNNTNVGTNGVSFSLFSGQGDHYMCAADVDDDGCQEIIYGGAIVDHNGDLYSSGGDELPSGTWAKYGHGDSIHVTDINPDRPGLEIFSCFEGGPGAPYGTALRDAELNETIAGNFSVYTGADTGRCMIGDLLSNVRGYETWGVNTTDAKGNIVTVNTIGTNQNINWAADMTTQIYTGNIVKANGTSTTTLLNAAGTSSNNGTKGNASLIADVFGDWREELVVRTTDSSALRIYTNTEVSTTKMYTLMHDTQYRAQVAGQNTSYNQPAYLSFYFAADTDWEYVPIPNAKRQAEPGSIEIAPTGVSLNLASITIKTNASKQLKATVSPVKASNKAVTFTSSDESIATVDANGLVTGVAKGTCEITATTVNGKTAVCAVTVKQSYAEAGLDEFPLGETRSFTFGTKESENAVLVGADTVYTKETGYGWQNADTIVLTEGDGYVAGNNVRTSNGTNVTYDYPTFTLDVPAGFYEVKLVQGSDTEDSVVGAYVEGNTYSVRWSKEGFSTSFTEPSAASYITTAKGTRKESTVKTAVADGTLTIQLATSLTDSGVSGTTYINSIEVTRVASNVAESTSPTLRFIGDSTVATYPPEDGGTWTPIPERTGWGSDFAMSQFMDDEVVLVNKAVAGSSIKSYLADGYYNDFFLSANAGDTVIIEGGINDSAVGRRYNDAAGYETYLRYFIDSCQTFGLDVVISSGTSSASTYTEVMERLAKEYGLPYIDLLGEYNAYKNRISSAAQGDLTVDGTHLARVGGVLAAQIVANHLAEIEGLSISGYVNAKKVNGNNPTAVVTGLNVKAQTSNSVTLSWNMDEDTLYDPDQLITRFNIYRKAKGAADSAYEKVGQALAYVSASMTAPKLQATVEAPETGDYEYAVSVVGLIGEGTKSSSIKVGQFNPGTSYQIMELLETYEDQMHDSTHYTAESYTNLAVALENAKEAVYVEDIKEETLENVLAKLKEAVAGLKRASETVMEDDFQSEAVGSVWGTTGHQLLHVIMEEDGNRLANAYVEAAGTRQIQKAITGVDSKLLTIEFEWYPGQPDQRNLTEIKFSDASGVYFSLKTSNNGHIGYVLGEYPTDSTGYLTGDGFHAANTQATDCGLSNELWYDVRIVFNYEAHTADLYLIPRDDETAPSKVVKDIPISENASEVTLMNFLCMRGKQDNGTSNDLSVLWDTYLDNFAIYYSANVPSVDTKAFDAAKEAYEAAKSTVSAENLTDEIFVKAEAVCKIAEHNIGFMTADDYAYAEQILKEAVNAVPNKIAAESASFAEEGITVTAGLSKTMTITTVPADANEGFTFTSSDESIATVSGNGKSVMITGVAAGTAVITAKTASGVKAEMTVTVTGTAYLFGANAAVNADSIYTAGANGFYNFTYPVAAAGWGEDGVYHARELSKVPGVSYINKSESGSDYLAVNALVWSENEGGRDEDAIPYENTSSFDLDLPNGNYEVNVTFTNPTKSAMDVVVKAEDIVRYASGDHGKSEIASASLSAGQTKTVTFKIALTDGSLTLRFEQPSDAAALSEATVKTVYVKGVSVTKVAKEAKGEVPCVYVLGDSTVQTYTKSNYRTGWGQVFYQLFNGADDSSIVEETSEGYAYYKTDSAEVKNYARDARSSKSFLEEGRLNEVLLNVKEGDYVLAQFTHNDSNMARPNRYLSLEDFRTYLENYKNAVEERGATFVLVTPIALNIVENGAWDHRFEAYRQVMLEMAEEENVPVLDLMGESYALLNEMGQTAVNALNMYMSDTVHLQRNGAVMYCGLLANQISAYDKDAQLDTLKAALSEQTPKVSFASNQADIGKGETKTLAVTMDGLEGKSVVYYSSDESIATVDASGKVTGVSDGTAIITAAVANGADSATTDCTVYTDYCLVTVRSASATVTVRNGMASVLAYAYAGNNFGVFTLAGNDTLAAASEAANEATKAAEVVVDPNPNVEDMMPKALYRFDFGSKDGTATGFTAITNGAYSAEAGYGFISDASIISYDRLDSGVLTSENATEDEIILASACKDAVRADNLEFAVDVPAGTYMVSLYTYVTWNLAFYQNAQYFINGYSVGNAVMTDSTPDQIAKSVKVTLTEPGQIIIKGENAGKLANFNALVISTYVEEVKTYDETAWNTAKDAIAVLNVKLGLMADNTTPLEYDASLISKMLATKAALKTVKGMPAADTAVGDELIAKANEAIENAALYTESSMEKMKTALDQLNAVIATMGGVKDKIVTAIDTIDYWLEGVDTADVIAPYSLYADVDFISGTNAYLTDGYVSLLTSDLYSAEKGYGFETALNGRNRGTGDSLFDDFALEPTFLADIPAGDYFMRVYCGDLLSGANNKSNVTITDVTTGNTLVSDVTLSSVGGEVSYTDMEFTVTADTQIKLAVSGRLNALILEQKKAVTVAEIDISELRELVEKIDAANLSEVDYTISSYQALAEALAEAKEAIEKGVSYTQQYESLLTALRSAYEGLTVREAAREILIDFGTETSAVSGAAKLSGDGGLTTLGTPVMQGLGTMVYEENMLDNGQHFGFDRVMPAYETSAGGAHFRDYVYSEGGDPYTFSADMPAGTYYVYVYTGDKLSNNTTKFYFGDGEEVVSTNTAAEEVDGRTVYTQTSAGGGQFSAPACIYTVTIPESDTISTVSGVALGHFSITLYDDTATASDAITARLNGIELTPVDPDAPLPTVAPTPSVSVTPSPSVTVSPTPSPEVTVTPSPEVTPTPEVTPSPVVTPSPEPTPTPAPAPSMDDIYVPSSLSFYTTEWCDLGIVLPEGMAESDVTIAYASSNELAATVMNDTIQLENQGVTKITTTITYQGETRTYVTKVVVKEPSVTITSYKSSMSVGESAVFTAASEGLSGVIVWSTITPDIVSVDAETGEVTALNPGSAIVYAYDGTTFKSVRVRVK
ncbi:MAG: hypothetical protein E7256_02190 [Lachnospiraceae bacterium]|nr:hypothetical protein [Lachnospiraceae bacterium]